ncbi:MAG: RpiB/LacA/LacB family sugar-phosphate isomerase [Candidatus Magasanikbacteria bacterium]|nr:RpiB/LacA/LacB family sugar-phosphate isomerase [Candidatus Magasanikbacteria bacterium]
MLYIASDHGGYQLKKYLLRYFKNQLKIKAVDLGPKKYVATDDLQDFAALLAKKVVKNKNPARREGGNRGILICRGGQGMAMTANKIAGIRAMMGFSIENVKWTVRDDHANVLCLAAEYCSSEHAAQMVKTFLNEKYDNDPRFLRRLKKIESLEK